MLEDNCPPTPPNTNPAGTWVSLNGSPMIRLNVSKNPPLPPPNSIEEGLRNFNIFPNPTKGKIKIRTTANKLEVTIFSSLGKIVKESIITRGDNEIHLLDQEKGVYFIKLKDHEKSELRKLVIQ